MTLIDVDLNGASTPPAPTPFHILCFPIQKVDGEIAVGDEFTDIALPHAVANITYALVILNAASCWTAPPLAIEGTIPADSLVLVPNQGLSLQIGAGGLVLIPDLGLPPTYVNGSDTTITVSQEPTAFTNTGTPIPFTAGGTPSPDSDNQSNGAWFEWIDTNTIRVHRNSSCGDCTDNCVAFTVQVLEFCESVIEIPT